LLKIIGKGGFGKVCARAGEAPRVSHHRLSARAQVLKVKKKDNARVYAMKVMDKSLFTSEKHLRSLLTEKNVMLNQCPFLVHLHYSFQVRCASALRLQRRPRVSLTPCFFTER